MCIWSHGRDSLTILAQSGPVEAASTYFTRRASQERVNAANATSPGARRAHLELAFRLVRIATEPALWRTWAGQLSGGSVARPEIAEGKSQVASTLAGAFPLAPPGPFERLLDAVDETDAAKR